MGRNSRNNNKNESKKKKKEKPGRFLTRKEKEEKQIVFTGKKEKENMNFAADLSKFLMILKEITIHSSEFRRYVTKVKFFPFLLSLETKLGIKL